MNQLEGVLLAHWGHELDDQTVGIIGDCPYGVCEVEFQCILWAPKLDQKLGTSVLFISFPLLSSHLCVFLPSSLSDLASKLEFERYSTASQDLLDCPSIVHQLSLIPERRTFKFERLHDTRS